MKTVKLKESTHGIIKYIQAVEINKKEDHTDIDSIVFKALAVYAFTKNYNLEELKKIIEGTKDE